MFQGVTQSTLMMIPQGKRGIVETLHYMRGFVLSSRKHMAIRTTALSLVSNFQQKDWLSEIRALHRFVRDEIRYTRDINDVETIQDPVYTLSVKQGDCDDKATLLSSLLQTIGYPTRFVAVGPDNNVFIHVLVEVFEPRQKVWIPLETTENVELGWYPQHLQGRLVLEV
jgi:transglutaminase-like putative cysteine protease